ncbi:MAG: TRIC cation channel family protein, partial [Neisseriaceae bacterium]|nr:TRIC cation channel family protein [Neisseriaceae bacterium]
MIQLNHDALTANNIIYLLDLVGVFACSATASLLAKRLQFDVLGAIMISFVGSVGGGTLRDLLLNRHPIYWLYDLNYLPRRTAHPGASGAEERLGPFARLLAGREEGGGRGRGRGPDAGSPAGRRD